MNTEGTFGLGHGRNGCMAGSASRSEAEASAVTGSAGQCRQVSFSYSRMISALILPRPARQASRAHARTAARSVRSAPRLVPGRRLAPRGTRRPAAANGAYTAASLAPVRCAQVDFVVHASRPNVTVSAAGERSRSSVITTETVLAIAPILRCSNNPAQHDMRQPTANPPPSSA
jgi:hypothetical protein